MNERKFNKDDFTEDEFMLLRIAFKLANTVVETQRENNYDVHLTNELFNLKDKLGISDLID